MDDSPSDYINIHFNPDKGALERLDKEYQAHQLLLRNGKYMARVLDIRVRYQVGSYEIDGDNPSSSHMELPNVKNLTLFDADIKTLSDTIQYPGDWFEGVKQHVLGFAPEGCLYSTNSKRILARSHMDNLELRIFGNFTQPELRSALKDVTALTKGEIAEGRTKPKSTLGENLLIYDLWKSGKSPENIVQYCNENGIEKILTPEDVRKYVYHTEQQVQEIVA